jgi:transposase
MHQEAVLADATLPDDPVVLQRMIHELLATLKDTRHELDGVRHRLDLLLKRLYGPKAERFDPNQPTLFDGCPLPPPTPEPTPPPADAATTPRPHKKGHGRQALPKHLRRERSIHDLTEAERLCSCCQQPRLKIGEECSERLDYVPASLFVVEHARFKYACLACLKKAELLPPGPVPDEPLPATSTLTTWLPMTESEAERAKLIVTAPMPPQPIAKGLAGPGLLAHIIVSKYVDHLPLHRLEGIFARQGVELSRSTMCDWMAECASLLTPLCALLKADVLRSRSIHTDDTSVPVQDPSQRRTKSGRLWVYIGDRDHPATVYDYTPTHARDGPAAFLRNYCGFLQADAHNVYDGIYTPELLEVGCWAHCRRHFHEARDSDAARAHEALARIAALYAVEDEAKEQITLRQLSGAEADELRRRLRQEQTVPLLTALCQWLRDQQAPVLPKSPMGLAIAYALRHWGALSRFTEHGFLAIDNNAAERALRAVAIGRKNWLFAGSDAGGNTAAVLYSMVATCKQLGIDPFTYLRDALTRLPQTQPAHHSDLLPQHWAATQRAAAATPS